PFRRRPRGVGSRLISVLYHSGGDPMTRRSLLFVALAALIPLAGSGCGKQAAAARKASKEYDQAEPDIRKALAKFFLPRVAATRDAPFGDPELLDLQLSFDQDRVGAEGTIPFRLTVLAGGKVDKAAAPETYKARLRHDNL